MRLRMVGRSDGSRDYGAGPSSGRGRVDRGAGLPRFLARCRSRIRPGLEAHSASRFAAAWQTRRRQAELVSNYHYLRCRSNIRCVEGAGPAAPLQRLRRRSSGDPAGLSAESAPLVRCRTADQIAAIRRPRRRSVVPVAPCHACFVSPEARPCEVCGRSAGRRQRAGKRNNHRGLVGAFEDRL